MDKKDEKIKENTRIWSEKIKGIEGEIGIDKGGGKSKTITVIRGRIHKSKLPKIKERILGKGETIIADYPKKDPRV